VSPGANSARCGATRRINFEPRSQILSAISLPKPISIAGLGRVDLGPTLSRGYNPTLSRQSHSATYALGLSKA
jgi:hypothetical protein